MLKKIKKLFNPNSPFYTLLLGLMSFMAVLISLFTLREMQAQREIALTPMIYPQKFDNKRIFADTTCGDFYSKSIVVKENGESHELEDWFQLGLINVGQGSAIDIELEWVINYDWFTHYLDTLNLDSIYFFNVEVHDSIGEVSLFYRYCGVGTSAGFNKNKRENFSHLLSGSDNNKGLKVPIPPRLIKFPIASIRAGWLKHGQNFLNTNQFDFEHQLKINYSDVNGKKYSSSYQVNMYFGFPSLFYEGDNFHVKAPKDAFNLKINLEKND